MTHKKILLINNNSDEAEIIQKTLDHTRVKYSLHIVKNGKEALNVLMGSTGISSDNYFRSRKVRPDVILMSNIIPDMTSSELLQIIRKYYSLKNIKIFLTITRGTIIDPIEFEKLALAGVFIIPFNISQLDSGFQNLKSELETDETPLESSLLLSFTVEKLKISKVLQPVKKVAFGGKSAVLNAGYATAAKVIVCTASVLAIGGAVNYQKNPMQKRVQNNMSVTLPPGHKIIEENTASAEREIIAEVEIPGKSACPHIIKPPQVVAAKIEPGSLKANEAEPVTTTKEPRPLVIKVIPIEDDSSVD